MAEDFDSYTPPGALHVDHLTLRLTTREGIEVVDEVEVPKTYYGVHYTFDILDGDGEMVERKQGDATPYMTPAQITGGRALMDALLAKAQASVST